MIMWWCLPCAESLLVDGRATHNNIVMVEASLGPDLLEYFIFPGKSVQCRLQSAITAFKCNEEDQCERRRRDCIDCGAGTKFIRKLRA